MPRFADFISFNFRGHGFQNQSRDPSALVFALVGSLKSPPWCCWCRWCCVSLTTFEARRFLVAPGSWMWDSAADTCQKLRIANQKPLGLNDIGIWCKRRDHGIVKWLLELMVFGMFVIGIFENSWRNGLLFRLGLHSIPSPCLRTTCMKRKGSSANTRNISLKRALPSNDIIYVLFDSHMFLDISLHAHSIRLFRKEFMDTCDNSFLTMEFRVDVLYVSWIWWVRKFSRS